MTKEENIAAYKKEWREANKEKLAAQRKAYKEANKEKLAAQQKLYREANREKILAKEKAYRESNREKMAAYRESNKEKKKAKSKAYHEANREKIAAKHKAYRESNREKIAAYRDNRLKTDPVFKFKNNLRSNVRGAFTRGGFTKNSSTFDILGCDWDTFLNHITSQFAVGMTLENHGEWHLDHQIPLALAETDEEAAELCYYTNYQPLWAKDNHQKSDKLIFDNISYSNKLRFIKYINRYEEANK